MALIFIRQEPMQADEPSKKRERNGRIASPNYRLPEFRYLAEVGIGKTTMVDYLNKGIIAPLEDFPDDMEGWLADCAERIAYRRAKFPGRGGNRRKKVLTTT